MALTERLLITIRRLLPRTDGLSGLLQCVKAWALLGAVYGVGAMAYGIVTIPVQPAAAIGITILVVAVATAKGAVIGGVLWCAVAGVRTVMGRLRQKS